MKPKHSDVSAGWINAKFARLEKLIRESNAAKRLQAATIGKGGLTVKDGGQINVRFPDGAEGIVLGPMKDGSGGQIGSAFEVHRGDGSEAVMFGVYHVSPGLSADFPAGYEFFQVSGDDIQLGADNQTIVGGGSSTIVVDSSGGVVIGSSAGTHIQHSTTAASANCFIDPSDWRIWRSTSSARYKADVEEAKIDPADVLALRPVTFLDKGEVQRARAEADKPAEERHVRRPRRYVGLLAEDVAKIPSLRPFVTLDDDGRPEALDYDRLTVALVTLAQSQQKTLDALDERVARLEADNT